MPDVVEVGRQTLVTEWLDAERVLVLKRGQCAKVIHRVPVAIVASERGEHGEIMTMCGVWTKCFGPPSTDLRRCGRLRNPAGDRRGERSRSGTRLPRAATT